MPKEKNATCQLSRDRRQGYIPSSTHFTVSLRQKSPFQWLWQKCNRLQPCKDILKLWTGKRSQAGLLKYCENLNSIRREVSLKKHLISLKYYLNKYQFDGLLWTIFLQFYRKKMPLCSLKRYIHAREVLNSPRQAFQRSQRLTVLSWRLPGIALNLENECPQKTNKSTSYTITLLSPKIGQDKTSFKCSRNDQCGKKKKTTFLLGTEDKVNAWDRAEHSSYWARRVSVLQ